MNIKVKAGLQTVAFFVVCVLTAFVANFVPTYILGGMALAGMFYLVYTLLLNRLEMDKKISEIKMK